MELFVPPRIWRPVAAEYPEDEAVRRIREVLTSSIGSFLDPERLQAIAEDHGAVERRVKIHTGRLIVALILSALRHAPDTEGRWLDAHTLYDRLGGPPVKPTALRTKIQQLEPTTFRQTPANRIIRSVIRGGSAWLRRRKLTQFREVSHLIACAPWPELGGTPERGTEDRLPLRGLAITHECSERCAPRSKVILFPPPGLVRWSAGCGNGNFKETITCRWSKFYQTFVLCRARTESA